MSADDVGPAIQADGLGKMFGAREAVRDVTFDVATGRAFGLLGPNGAGKTTTVRLLTGLLAPTAGTVSLFGERLTRDNADALRARIGVQTDTNLYETLTVRENLRTWGELYGLDRRTVVRRTDEVLEVLTLTDRVDSLVGELSKGMRQKLSVGRAVLHEPELLFLDEPTAGLDPEAAEDLVAYLSRTIRETSTTVVICTHQLHGLEHLCTDVGILAGGRLVVAGDVAALLRQRWPRLRWTLTVGDDLARAMRVVAGVVGDVMPDGAAGMRFEVDEPAAVSSVVEALVDEGIAVRSVVPREPTLHDLYFATIDEEGRP